MNLGSLALQSDDSKSDAGTSDAWMSSFDDDTDDEVSRRVLCVDDEPNVLQGLTRTLGFDFEVSTAEGGAAGLATIAEQGPFAVVISDMRMPEMDGAEFLSRVRVTAPDTVRILLTGHAELDSAISAVNDGQIFRFLTKPCAAETLTSTIESAVKQYRLITAEKELLEKTLRGAVKTLCETLSLANPAVFGRAARIQRYVLELVEKLKIPDAWYIEVAAVLSQIPYVNLPERVLQKVYLGHSLDPAEQKMAEQIPEVGDRLLSGIPRLEPVREIIRHQDKQYEGDDEVKGNDIPVGARILKVAMDYEGLESRGLSDVAALRLLKARRGVYDPRILEVFERIRKSSVSEVVELKLTELEPMMVVAEDVTSLAGAVIVPRGNRLTPRIMERLHNFANKVGVKEPIPVRMGAGGGE